MSLKVHTGGELFTELVPRMKGEETQEARPFKKGMPILKSAFFCKPLTLPQSDCGHRAFQR